MEFSVTYNIDARELVEIFVAYCVNNLNNAEPTLSTLDDFERKELQKRTSSSKTKAFQPKRSPIDIDEYGGDSDGDDDNDVMSAYIVTTPKVFIPISLFTFLDSFITQADLRCPYFATMECQTFRATVFKKIENSNSFNGWGNSITVRLSTM